MAKEVLLRAAAAAPARAWRRQVQLLREAGTQGYCRKKKTDIAAGRLVKSVEEASQEPEHEVGGLFLCAVEKAASAKRSEVNAVMKFCVDSCAGISVLPESTCQDHPSEKTARSKASTAYYPAGVGTSVKDLGDRALNCGVASQNRRMRLRACNIRKPLLAVSGMVNVGHDVQFSKDIRYDYHPGITGVHPN